MTAPRSSLAAIARPSGGLAMVAMDQRESLRTMHSEAGVVASDEDLTRFKVDVARALAPLASGFLIDRQLGLAAVREHAPPPAGCGLIVAADALQQQPGGLVEETELDDEVVARGFDLRGVAAVKLLVIWRRDARREERVELARRFIAVAAERGVASVLEPVVRATPRELDDASWDTDVAIREAARELSPLGAGLYKVQVPRSGRGTSDELRTACAELAADIVGPWVVLSQGIHRDDFHGAVTAACQSGASGFLAGRALWSDVVGSEDTPAMLRTVSVPRLQRLVEVVDRHAQPWSELSP